MNKIVTLYHGSSKRIESPDISNSRTDIDFGAGFYMTDTQKMAGKWACNTVTSYVNSYRLTLDGLRIKKLEANEEWLDFVIYNRTNEGALPFSPKDYDLIIGPTADDKLFATIDLYSEGLITKEHTIKIVNCMNYSNQFVLMNQECINRNLQFVDAKELKGFERENLYKSLIEDRKNASQKALQLQRELIRG